MARPPNEVTFTFRASPTPTSGDLGTQAPYFAPPAPLSVALGGGALPAGLEAALGSMSQGERAVLIVPAAQMGGGDRLVPAPPAGLEQVELEIELQQLVQVRGCDCEGGASGLPLCVAVWGPGQHRFVWG